MRYGSVCSGIEAATAAWHPLGWSPAFFSEIDPAPRAVLAHHYPDVPLHGDFTTIGAAEYGAIDLLVGGTPCQDFSVAGLRAGLDGERGNLTLEFLRLLGRKRARWVVWENVPGTLSSLSHVAPDCRPPEIDLDSGDGPEDGEEVVVEDSYDADESHAFACFLAGLSELGYGFAYRILDAQHFGVPQRRRRVFVVGYLGDWRRAAAVLLERHSLSGDSPPRREKGQRVARPIAGGSQRGSGYRNDADTADSLIAFGGNNTAGPIDVATACNAHGGPTGRLDFETETFVAHAFDARQRDVIQYGDLTGPLDTDAYSLAVAFTQNSRSEVREIGGDGQIVGALAADADAQQQNYVAFQCHGSNVGEMGTLRSGNGNVTGGVPFVSASAVRRLTPRECERLQGFPDTTRTVRITVCEDEKAGLASCAQQSSAARNRDPSAPVAARVLIDLERQAVQLLRADGLSWSASDAEKAGSSPLSMPADAFVRLAAHTIISLVPATPVGAAASQLSITPSIHRWSGSASVVVSGREIAELAADAGKFTSEASQLSRFTTSPSGHDTQTAEQTLRTWSSCVLAAIAGFIPDEIRSASSYTVEVTVEAGFTLVPYRGKPMADGPRYKMLGNSMAVPVMRWIGERIAAVEALGEERAAA